MQLVGGPFEIPERLRLELTPEGIVDAPALSKLVASVSKSIAKLGDMSNRAISIETIDPFCALIGYLAVWNVGATAVPISPEIPEIRQEYMRKKAGTIARLYFDDSHRIEVGSCTVVLESNPEDWATYSSGGYVLFTSGSTGQPKGVLVSSDALSARIDTLATELNVENEIDISALTNPTFDISLAELLLPFRTDLIGLFPGNQYRKNVTDIARWLGHRNPSIIQGTPSLFSMLLSIGWAPSSATTVWCGGETLNSALASQLTQRAKGVWNLYGPTEATIWSTAWKLTNTGSNEPIPIGSAFLSTKAKIVDEGGDESNEGELWLSGEGIAEGYVRDTSATQVAFPTVNGTRWYRTGDICGTRPDGTLSFRGRRDGQIKVRGFRVELGEVEEVISRLPGVFRVAVLPEVGPRELVARLVAVVAAAPQWDSRSLKAACKAELPQYMRPSKYVIVSEMPLLNSGKVDRASLSRMLFSDPRIN